uniref:Double jelly roll-like domain-containing protein n=1 Tax=Sipha flava TaxID=143950 RepID=A0A2S2QXC3_9HEMI
MDRSYLDVTEPYVNEAPIQEMFLHSFLPFSSTAINKGDEIRIPIQNRDAVTLPSESFIYIEGKLIKPADLLSEITFCQNGLINLFNEIKYEINSVEIQRVKRPGVSSSLKGYCSYTPADVNCLQNATWDDADSNRKFIKDGTFTGCIPLKHVLGFAEDYNKVLINCSQQLILNRATDDLGSLTFFLKGNEVLSDATVQAKVKTIKIELTKVMWKVPVVKVNDREKLKLLKIIDSKKTINCAFRNWELCEYPNIPQTRKHSWMVKTCSRVEKPRCLIIAFLRKDSSHMTEEFASDFDACSLTNVKAYINSVEYPYENYNESFDKDQFTMFYQGYADFQKYYYERMTAQPYLSKEKYKELGPFICIDCSRQNDDAKTSTIDLRIEFEAANNFQADTSAYCLLIHDRVIQYNPFTGEVRKN